MIDFRFDGPCGSGSEGGARMRVLGLGQAGIAALDQIILHGHETMDLWAIDTDQQTLDGSVLRDKILLGADMTFGLGCGGDVELARDVVEATATQWSAACKNTDYLVLLVGLGGATGNALSTEIVSLAQREETRVIVLATLPFGFEGRRRRDQAERTLSQLRATADAVLVFSNDRLADLPESVHNLRHAYGRLNRVMAEGVDALGQMLCQQGMIQLTFADIRSLYGRYSGTEVLENCWSAFAEVEAGAGPERLVGEVLSDPMLGDDIWEHADHGLVCLSGGEEMSLTDVQEALAHLQGNLPEDFPLAIGATLSGKSSGRLRMVLLLASTRVPVADTMPEPAENPALEDSFYFSEPGLSDTAPLPKIVPAPQEPVEESPAEELAEPVAEIIEEPAEPVSQDIAEPVAAEAMVEEDVVVEEEPLAEAGPMVEELEEEVLPPAPAAVQMPPKPEPVAIHSNASTQRIDVPNYYKEHYETDEDEVFEPEPEPAIVGAAAAAPASARGKSRQEELPFEPVHRGRFEKSVETIHNGEDLDVPTFRRRRLKVRM